MYQHFGKIVVYKQDKKSQYSSHCPDFEIVKFLFARPDNGHYIIEPNDGIIKMLTEVEMDDVIELEDALILIREQQKKYLDKITRLKRGELPPQYIVQRIKQLEVEIKNTEDNMKRSWETEKTKALKAEAIKQKKRGIKRISRRIYSYLKNHALDEVECLDYSMIHLKEELEYYQKKEKEILKLLEEENE